MKQLLVLHGPNLNLLGQREPGIYGDTTLATIDKELQRLARLQDFALDCFQSNAEHQLIEYLHQAMGQYDFVIFNPAAFTHTSVALRDAILAVGIPFIEVHLSDPKTREPFRHHSYFSDIAVEVIAGQGANSYYMALKNAIDYLLNK